MMSDKEFNFVGKRIGVGIAAVIAVFAIRDFGWMLFVGIGTVIGAVVGVYTLGAVLCWLWDWLKRDWYWKG